MHIFLVIIPSKCKIMIDEFTNDFFRFRFVSNLPEPEPMPLIPQLWCFRQLVPMLFDRFLQSK